MGAFGEKLRKQREQRGITLDAISKTTKISTRMLRALEDEHFDQLPGGVFNKGFVRAYARQVGLNEEEAITDYLAALRESQVQSQNILPDFRTPANTPLEVAAPGAPQQSRHNVSDNDPRGNDRGNDDRSNEILLADRRKQNRRDQDRRDQSSHNENPAARTEPPRHADHSAVPAFATGTHDKAQSDSAEKPPAKIPWGMLVAALLVVSAVLAFWNFRRQNQITAASPPSTSNQPAPPVAAPPVSSSPSATSKPSSSGNSLKIPQAPLAPKLPVGTSSAVATPPVKSRASMPSPAAPMPAPSRVATTTAASTPSDAANPPATNAAAHTSAAKPLATFSLLIRADKTTWVSIVADGKPVAEETLIAPAHTSVRATREIVVKAGNAAGISFLFNGKEIPAQGNDGEVRTYVFDATTSGVLP